MAALYSAQDKLKCILRELAYRERVYPRWIDSGKMSEALAKTQIETMRQIAQDYEALASKEKLL